VRYLGDDEAVPVIRNMLLAIDGLEAKGRVLDTVTATIDDDGAPVVDATTLRFFKLDLLGQLLHTAASPPVAYLLVTIGSILLVFEFFTAGIGVAAMAGVISGVLGTYGLAALPTRGWAVALLVASVLALAVDVQVGVPRAWTAIGLVAYTVASFSLFNPIPGSSLRPSWITMISGVALTAIAFVAGMPSMVRTRFATPTIGRDWMVGEEGVAAGAVAPEGTVELRGARWRARVNRATPLVDGQACRVVAIDGVTLEVEPLEGGARDYREMRRRPGVE
jgi:membrane-bound serine protease (ClpP class)